MTISVHELLTDLRASSTSTTDQGARFERLMEAFLQTDPTFADQFSRVYSWKNWPGNGGKADSGIDLVAVDRLTGENVAIQCKFYAEKHHVSKKDIDTFLSASGKEDFGQRIIIDTTASWGPTAEETIKGQRVPVRRIGLTDLGDSAIDWSRFSWSKPQELTVSDKKHPRPHQRTAIDKVTEGFKAHDRGKLIMACGTGKTFTSLRLAEETVGAGGTVLFLVPSISLLSQTVREWANNATVPLNMLAVCSDAKATRKDDDADISAVDLALPATTNVATLTANWAKAADESEKMTVVFSTYQSIEVIAQTQQQGGFGPFDLIICDEAHRTTGAKAAGSESAFMRVHDDTFIQGSKRLYMTATPRIFGEDAKEKAQDGAAVIASMDDEAIYGPEFHRLGFGEAVEKNLLTDYRVVILSVDEEYVAKNFQRELSEDGEIQLGDAARMVGCWNGLAKHFDTVEGESLAPMQRAVAFAKDIKTSKAVAAAFPMVVDKHARLADFADTDDEDSVANQDLGIQIRHVDGTYNAQERNKHLAWLKEEPEEGTCRILTNARCLSEGVDVPNLDAVMFLTPRGSEVDIVQSVGRVMRRSEGKDYGYIILPIVVPSGVAPEVALSDNKKYAVVWQVLRALRAHDDRFNAMINKIELNKKSKPKNIGTGHTGPDGDVAGRGDEYEQGELDLTWGDFRGAIYAKIVEKVGERRYWESWAADVAEIATQHIARINGIMDNPDSPAALEFDRFLTGLQGNLNDGITRDDAVEMLAQHLITRPVFEALFGGYDFVEHNPVAKAMERMLTLLDEHTLDTENSSLEGFYDSVRTRVEGIDNAEGRQRIIVELYDKFFATAFKRTVDKLGIVYTPVEIVDFILRSANAVLKMHFGQSLSDEGVHIMDGFTGTGTFMVRLLQLGLIDEHDLARKYANEMHANEILLLAYYIAAVNIETTFQDLRGSLEEKADYEPFPGLILTDTFQSWENDDRLDEEVFVQNNERLKELKKLDIQVIVGNPPYSSGQKSANENNANEKYPDLDEAIRTTYAALSSATNKNSLYDSYIRAIKWASLRIKDRGVIAYVTNGGWVDSNTADGMRKSLAGEFSDVYVLNLKGNMRSSDWRREGGQIFGAGSQTTVAVVVLVKDPTKTGEAKIRYTDIGDYLTREQKLAKVSEAEDVFGLDTVEIAPNEHGDWLNQRRDDFETFPSIETIFDDYGRGLETARDAWVYNFDSDALRSNAAKHIASYEAARLGQLSEAEANDPTRISWSHSLRSMAARNTEVKLNQSAFTKATYRPFCKVHNYIDRPLINRAGAALRSFPGGDTNNIGFYQVGVGAQKDFVILMIEDLPDLNFYGSEGGQLFARYRYEKTVVDESMLSFDLTDTGEVIDGYRRIDNITNEALARFQAAYGASITKDDIFFYVYGLLHSPEYRETYKADLKKMLPHIPFVDDPKPFIDAGRALSTLHLDYEKAPPYPLEGLDDQPRAGVDPYEFYAVGTKKMAFGKPTAEQKAAGERYDRSQIHYNSRITLKGIPERAYGYMLGSRSAIEWIVDRYYIKTDKASGIVNNPNAWSRQEEDPRYIMDLLARIVTVSVETMSIVDALPPLKIRPEQ